MAPSHPGPAGWRRLRDSRTVQPECGVAGRPAVRGDDHGRAGLRRTSSTRTSCGAAPTSGAFAACASTAAPPPAAPCVTSAARRRLDGPNVRQHDGRDARLQPAYAVGNERPRHRRLHDSQGRRAREHGVPAAAGPRAGANHAFTKDQVTWEPSSAARATQPCPAGARLARSVAFTPQGHHDHRDELYGQYAQPG